MKKQNQILAGFLTVVLLLLCSMAAFIQKTYTTMNEAGKRGKYLVVIDPGHGGFDPGKVGVSGVLEKDINLAIAMKVKRLLEQNDIMVQMTRETDTDLSDASLGSSKKSTDMRERVKRVNGAGADVAVSIHQNSFTDSSSRGAQVFYHTGSEEGKKLAELLQAQLKETMQDGNHRMEKSNASYYMLKKTECPFAIVECGFLSNPEQEANLTEEWYQDRLAWAIHLGILQYLHK